MIRSKRNWTYWRGVGLLIALVVLVGCVVTVEPSTDFTTLDQSIAQTVSSGIVDLSSSATEGAGSSMRLEADEAQLYFTLDDDSFSQIEEMFDGPIFVDYVLQHHGGENWNLYHAHPLPNDFAPDKARMGLLIDSEGEPPLYANGDDFLVSGTTMFPSGDSTDAPVAIEDAIQFIIDDLDAGAPPPGRVLPSHTAFLVLSDGNISNPLQTLIIFGSVQSDASVNPSPPGGAGDPCGFCAVCVNCPWWCRYC